MSAYSVEELTEMTAKLQRALAEAKDNAEQEKTAKTPTSAPKKIHNSARARSRRRATNLLLAL